MNDLKKTTPIISILQLFVFIISFLVIYGVIVFVAFLLSELIKQLPIINIINYWFPMSDSILFTFAPIISAFSIHSFCNLLFKKYYFNTISTIIFFALVSWLMVDHIIRMVMKYGLISWDSLNWIWSDVILMAVIFCMFYARTELSNKENDKS